MPRKFYCKMQIEWICNLILSQQKNVYKCDNFFCDRSNVRSKLLLLGHLPNLVGHCLMSDSNLQPCTINFKHHSGTGYELWSTCFLWRSLIIWGVNSWVLSVVSKSRMEIDEHCMTMTKWNILRSIYYLFVHMFLKVLLVEK
jgi:hypothetical protein